MKKRKNKLSEEGRKKIVEAQKRRWARDKGIGAGEPSKEVTTGPVEVIQAGDEAVG